MGICNSCESTSVATAKIILQDGRLQEFSYPIKAWYLLQKDPTIFICNSDEMELGDKISAINAEEELQLGQLYFAMPLKRLRSRLGAEEMAALAVKASSALKRTSSSNKPFVFSQQKNCDRVTRNGDGGDSGRRRGKKTVKLSVIPE
ncbi:uncharacterized protein LOC107013971 [Solanum pennellii]|uniref:Uncharacterized protein LOC107013971 n=1 Tax=Solanum pennellii TaxID=28526 RepID=A0ABM1GCX2_SOLPN|nr:uncharacterized protein LOC107013971 [Solanum pennellii]